MKKEESVMKLFYLCAMSAFLLLGAIMSGCSSAAPAGQPEPGTEGTALASATEDIIPEVSSWEVVLECKVTHPAYIVGFLNEDFGITVGAHGEIHYSADGSKTWPESENNSLCRYCLDIVDENIAWCGGNGNDVRLSGDGGRTWTAASDVNLTTAHSNIDFIDDTTGWIASVAKLAGTGDGGKTWTDISLPEGADGVAAICLRTNGNGYVLSRDGMLYATADGGATWSSKDLGFKDYDIIDLQKQPKLIKINPTVADMSFPDENNGVIVFTCSISSHGRQTWCLTTGDGGITWESELIPETGFTTSKVFVSDDGQYITLSDGGNKTAVLKKKA